MIDSKGEQLGVMPTSEAINIAYEKDLDLVEVSPHTKPPVCRLMDYGKYKYQQSKREREARQKSKTFKLKEIELRPKINEHDFQTKLRHIKEFLEEGFKVKVTLFFRGREIVYTSLARKLMDRVIEGTSLLGAPEYEIRREGKRLLMVLAPKPAKESSKKS